MATTKRSNSNIKPVASDLFESQPSKSQAQQIRIMEAAIESFAKHGIEKTTYTHLAKECEISRPLIHHYFPALEDLFLLTAKYVRKTLLNSALAEMQRAPNDTASQLRAYLKGCFSWVREYPAQCSFWLLYYYQASLRGAARDENTALVQAGHERIEALIREGIEMQLFAVDDPKKAAKTFQAALTGFMISAMTEDGYLSVRRAEELCEALLMSKLLTPA